MAIELAELEHPQAPLEHLPAERRAISRWWFFLGVFVLWVAGWLMLQGQWTLALPVSELNSFHDWLNEVRDWVEQAKFEGNPLFIPFEWITEFFNWVVEFLQKLFVDPAFGRPVPVIGWLGLVGISTWVALAIAGVRSAILVAGALVLCGTLGYWEDTVDTLIITGVSVAVCVLLGIPIGIWMSRSKRVTAALTPVLDVMQTMPSFSYLAPLALFYGIGPAAAVVTTLIYALPPLIRISAHGLRTVSPTTMEATSSLGSTDNQQLRKVQLPMARRTILVGLNQTTMAALSMAVIAALINGPGLGIPVIDALTILNVGRAFVAGLCLVFLAIMLDRMTTAAGERAEASARKGTNPQARRILLGVTGVLALISVYLSRQYLRLAEFPEEWNWGDQIADRVNSSSEWFVDTFYDITQAAKDFVSNFLLNPLQDLLAESPWWLTASALLAIAFLLGGRRALVATAVTSAIILGTGLWYDAMVTLAMTLVAAVMTMVIGVIVGVWMGRSRRVDALVRPVLDMLQTLPAFVYLIPTLALFGPGRFLAIMAAVAYAVPIAIKIAADGIRGVSPTTVEAAESTGSNRWQMIGKVQLPMARGSLVLAANQGLLFVLSMVVIGGLVGGGGLGFLVVGGFSQQEDFGKGLAAGIAITALGVMLDRITVHTAARYGRAETA
ncbi:MAG: ABC transporter permease subunit [Actinomycetia bacterium]|nr:ABC transporter permease subunit [Actinomycetes bacterium]